MTLRVTTLREDRCNFTKMVSLLIGEAVRLGFDPALDEGTVRLTTKNPTGNHMKGSLHYEGLALDLLLYKDGVYITDTETYAPLGEFWEQLGVTHNLPLRWGGRFKDGNHFSHERNGKK